MMMRDGLDAFLSEPFVSRDALLADERVEGVPSSADASGMSCDGHTDAVSVWRKLYFDWCEGHNADKASATMFTRAVNERFGLRSVPCGRRAHVDGRAVQYRIFVEDADRQGDLGSDASFGDSASLPSVSKSPTRVTRLDVESYAAREKQLGAYVRYGYVNKNFDDVLYDGVHLPDEDWHPRPSDSALVPAMVEVLSRDEFMGYDLAERIHFTRDVAQVAKDGRWYLQRLPEGECLLSVSHLMPVPTADGEGCEMAWVRLTLHLRQAGVRHYGKECNAQLDEGFVISHGSMFSDGCLLGLTVSIFDEYVNACSEVVEREFTFDAPQRDFDCFGTAILSSSTATIIMGDQTAVRSLANRVDSGEDSASTRELDEGEPSFAVTYAPRYSVDAGGVVDYTGGVVPDELGTYVVTRQLDSSDVFSAEGVPVEPRARNR